MDKHTFLENFAHEVQPRKTYLCYEVELQEDDAWIPVDEFKGFLCNQAGSHAELCLLGVIRSWELNTEQHYRVTCFISWSPCHDCARELVLFLGKNSHLSLRIFASRIYTLGGYKTGLRQLQAAGAQVTTMTSREFEYCWETFVNHRRTPFFPWDDLDKLSEHRSKVLKDILQDSWQLPIQTSSLLQGESEKEDRTNPSSEPICPFHG